jgi:hypothetical protein
MVAGWSWDYLQPPLCMGVFNFAFFALTFFIAFFFGM